MKVPVERYPNLTEAAFGQAVLEAAGIASEISSDNAGGMIPLPFSGVIRLMVDPADLDEARAVLSADAEADPSDGEEAVGS